MTFCAIHLLQSTLDVKCIVYVRFFPASLEYVVEEQCKVRGGYAVTSSTVSSRQLQNGWK